MRRPVVRMSSAGLRLMPWRRSVVQTPPAEFRQTPWRRPAGQGRQLRPVRPPILPYSVRPPSQRQRPKRRPPPIRKRLSASRRSTSPPAPRNAIRSELDITEHGDSHDNRSNGDRHHSPIHTGLQGHDLLAGRIQLRGERRFGGKRTVAQDSDPFERQYLALARLSQPTPENGLRLRFIAPCGAADQFHERNTLFRRAEIDFVARRRDLLPRQAARTAMRHIERTYTGNYDGTVIQQLTGNDLIYLCDHGVLCFGEKAISAQVSFYGRAKRASPRRQGATTPARSYKFRKG